MANTPGEDWVPCSLCEGKLPASYLPAHEPQHLIKIFDSRDGQSTAAVYRDISGSAIYEITCVTQPSGVIEDFKQRTLAWNLLSRFSILLKNALPRLLAELPPSARLQFIPQKYLDCARHYPNGTFDEKIITSMLVIATF